jgi:hypothetical protein
MANLNCLIIDTQIVEDIKEFIRELSIEKMENELPADIATTYREIRDLGFEVDLESVGVMYNEVFNGVESDLITPPEIVEKYVGMTYANSQSDIANAIIGKFPDSVEEEIGRMPPEKQISTYFAKLFQKKFYENKDPNTRSIMLKMQDMVKLALTSSLPRDKRENNAKSINTLLTDFFDLNSQGVRTLSGTMNNMEKLFGEVKNQLDNYVEELVKGKEPAVADIIREQWNGYAEAFMNSAYDIILTKTNQRALLNEVMKKIEVNGNSLVDQKGNIKWSELSSSGDVDEIKRAVFDLFRNGYEDKAGVKVTFSANEANMIANYVGNLYSQKIQAITQRDLVNKRLSNQSPKNLISDFIKSLGQFSISKDSEGKLTKSKSLPTELVREFEQALILGSGTSSNLMQMYLRKLDDFLRRTDASGNSELGLTDEKIEEIKNAFQDYINAKLLPKTATPNNLQKLFALTQLHNGIAFNQSTQQAVNRVVGVSNVSQSVLTQISNLSQAAGQLMQSPDMEYAYIALAEIDRKIKELLYEHKIDQNLVGGILASIKDYMSASTSTLLLNPNNFLENISTGFGTAAVGESIKALISLPPSISKELSKDSAKSFWSAFFTHIFGGAHGNVVNDYERMRDISGGERLRFTKNELKEIRKSPAKWFGKFPLKVANTAMRVGMNSFDVATMEVIARNNMVVSLYKSLVQVQGKEKAEETMKQALNLTDAQMAEIDASAEKIMNILKSVGITPTAAHRALIRNQIKTKMYVDAIYANTNIDLKTIERNVKALSISANEVSKILGGKKKLDTNGGFDIFSIVLYAAPQIFTSVQNKAFKSAEGDFEKGNYGKGFAKEFITSTVFQNGIAKFVGGVANFAVLGLTVTPIGYFQAASQKAIQKKFLEGKPLAQSFENASPEDFEKYNTYKSVINSILVRATIGTGIMLAYLGAALAGDDEDDDMIDYLLVTESGRRLVAKLLPLPMTIMTFATNFIQTPDGKLDTGFQRLVDLGTKTYFKDDRDSWTMFLKDLDRSKGDIDKIRNAVARLAGSVWGGNLDQAEQITRFKNVMDSGFSKDRTIVEMDEGTKKEFYKGLETPLENYFATGMFNTIIRTMKDYRDLNRFDIETEDTTQNKKAPK